jgi:L-fucose isomerase-like protein
MERRNFIKSSVGATITGAAVLNGLYMKQLFGNTDGLIPDIDIPSPHLTRLLVKPIMTNMYHTDVWEGPCRFNVLTMEEEKERALKSYNGFKDRLAQNSYGIDLSNVELFDPDLVLFVEDFKVTDEMYNKIEQDAQAADVLFIHPGGASIITHKIAEKYQKPVVISSALNCRSVDITASFRSKGLEAYIMEPDVNGEIDTGIFDLLRARKVFKNTRILYPSDWGWPPINCTASIDDIGQLKEMYGIEMVKISYKELASEMEKNLQSPQAIEEAQKMAAIMYENADHSYLDQKYVIKSMQFYQTVINLMKKHQCNSFTIECFEFCTSRLPQKWNITPCLIHTMFKDLGIPSACEGDLGALLSMHMLMSVSKKSAHLGNMFSRENGRMEINHSVPGIKMNGYDKPGLPYQLGRFVESGWGTKAVVDFMNNEEKDITVARIDPTGTKLLILKGMLVGSKGWDEDLRGCSVSAYVVGKKSGTALEYMVREEDYGNHLCWVYGDYANQMEKLGGMMGMEVTTVA